LAIVALDFSGRAKMFRSRESFQTVNQGRRLIERLVSGFYWQGGQPAAQAQVLTAGAILERISWTQIQRNIPKRINSSRYSTGK